MQSNTRPSQLACTKNSTQLRFESIFFIGDRTSGASTLILVLQLRVQTHQELQARNKQYVCIPSVVHTGERVRRIHPLAALALYARRVFVGFYSLYQFLGEHSRSLPDHWSHMLRASKSRRCPVEYEAITVLSRVRRAVTGLLGWGWG